MSLIQISQSILDDAKVYLQKITPDDYGKPIDLLSKSTIGQHTRHFIEFYLCLLNQAECSCNINYDKRERDKRIEENPVYALQCIDRIIEGLNSPRPMSDFVLHAEFDTAISVPTYFDREILYNIEHSIHHLAIIKIGLKIIAPQIELPPHFGVAASTIKYRTKTESGVRQQTT